MASVVIDIASEFTGKKAFKQADTATDKLSKSAKNLAKSIGLAFSTAAIIGYGRKSLKAALESQAQQQRLAKLMKVTVNASDAQIASLNAQAEALANVGVVTAGNITQTQSQLATFNLQADTIKTLTPAILDYVTAEKGAAASASEFKSMTNGLAQALNGNFASLTKTGFVLDDVTKKTIATGTESERAAALVAVLDSTYKDFNKSLRDTPAGKMQVLANAADDVSVAIGTGIIDALTMLSDDHSVDNLAKDMQNLGTYTADVIRGVGILISELQKLPGAGPIASFFKFADQYNPITFLSEIGAKSKIGAGGSGQKGVPAELLALEKYSIVQKKILKDSKKLTAEEKKRLAAKKLGLAIDKANLALGKGEDIFDMDKIQLNAALIGQAEALGKATTGAQILAIANDVQRLKIKQDIAALEDAIASKDTAAIAKATAKLNEDLKILGVLQKQDAKLLDINNVLASMKSVDLINLTNLQDALALLAQFTFPSLCAPTTMKPGTKTPEFLKSGITMIGKTPFVTGSVIDPLASLKTVEDTAKATSVLPEYISATEFYTSLTDAQKADLGGYSPYMNTGAGYGAGGSIVVNVSAGAIGDENIIVDAVQNALNEIARRGYLTTYAGAIAV
jgi:hypothetical protein